MFMSCLLSKLKQFRSYQVTGVKDCKAVSRYACAERNDAFV